MTDKAKSYRELDNELQLVIDKLQSDQNDVDGVLKEYEKGIKLVKDIESYLKTAQNKINKLTSRSTKRQP